METLERVNEKREREKKYSTTLIWHTVQKSNWLCCHFLLAFLSFFLSCAFCFDFIWYVISLTMNYLYRTYKTAWILLSLKEIDFIYKNISIDLEKKSNKKQRNESWYFKTPCLLYSVWSDFSSSFLVIKHVHSFECLAGPTYMYYNGVTLVTQCGQCLCVMERHAINWFILFLDSLVFRTLSHFECMIFFSLCRQLPHMINSQIENVEKEVKSKRDKCKRTCRSTSKEEGAIFRIHWVWLNNRNFHIFGVHNFSKWQRVKHFKLKNEFLCAFFFVANYKLSQHDCHIPFYCSSLIIIFSVMSCENFRSPVNE